MNYNFNALEISLIKVGLEKLRKEFTECDADMEKRGIKPFFENELDVIRCIAEKLEGVKHHENI